MQGRLAFGPTAPAALDRGSVQATREVLGVEPTEHAVRDDHHIDELSWVDERDELWALLATLGRRQRAVLVLRSYEDPSEAEIARLHDWDCQEPALPGIGATA